MNKLDFNSLPDETHDIMLDYLYEGGRGDIEAIKELNNVGISFYESHIEWLNDPEDREYFCYKQIFLYQGKFWCLHSTFQWNGNAKDNVEIDWDNIYEVVKKEVTETKWVQV